MRAPLENVLTEYFTIVDIQKTLASSASQVMHYVHFLWTR